MTKTYALRVKAAASAVLLALLAACAGGDDLTTPVAAVTTPVVATTTPTSTQTAADISIEGTAATGAPLANAKVSILCNSGDLGKDTQADANGKYSTTVASTCAAPYMIKVTGVDTSTTPTSTITLYAFADKAGNINITPLTDIAAKFATNNDPDGEYAAVLAKKKKADELWTATGKTDAQANLKKVLDKLGVTTTIALDDLLHGKFDAKLGDKTDDLLEKLKKERGGVPLKDLVEQVANRGGSTLTATERKPWLALFPQQKSFTLTATGCSGNYESGSNTGINTGLNNATVVATFALTTTGFKVSALVSQAATTQQPGASSFEMPATIGSTTELSNVALSDFVFSTGSFSVNAFNNVLNFSANRGSSMDSMRVGSTRYKSQDPNAVVVTTQTFYLGVFASGPGQASASINCATSLPTITAASRPDFSIPARIASLAGTATSITSPVTGLEGQGSICQGYVPSSQTSGTFTYAVSPATGDVKFSGKSLAANWFLNTGANYSEYHNLDVGSGNVAVSLNPGQVGGVATAPFGDLRMNRYFINSGRTFDHYCNSND